MDLPDTSPSQTATTFARMEQEAPALARRARDRFEVTGLCLLATLRSDGWPRLSPLEPLVHEGQLYLGMMPGSTKSRDLARDPRCLVHSVVADKDGTEGEVKLYGRARAVTDPDEVERFCVALEEAIGWRPSGLDELDLWVHDVLSAVHQRFSGTEGTQVTDIWRPGQGVSSTTRTHAV